MPILTQPTSHPKRRRPWLWVILGVPVVVLALLVGLVARSWFQPVSLWLPEQQITLHRVAVAPSYGLEGNGLRHVWIAEPYSFWGYVKLPGGLKTGWYGAWWSRRHP
jgi:hypothetical protein